jgi:hypothetical protein
VSKEISRRNVNETGNYTKSQEDEGTCIFTLRTS